MFIVYKLIRSDLKIYVGSTTKDRFRKRINEHKCHTRFKDLPFTIEILVSDIKTHEDCLNIEKEWIHKLDSWRNGLNETPDGTGLSRSHKFTTLGYKHTKETKKKIGSANKGKIPWNKGRSNCYSKKTIEGWKKKRAGKQHSTKLNLKQVEEIRSLFENKPILEGTGTIMKNGRCMSYLQNFSKIFAPKYNITPACIRKIIKRETWNV